MPNTVAETIRVAVGVLIRDGRVLVAQRPEGVHLAHYWEFPGGKVELHEPLEEALKREFEEELGIRISGISSLMEISHCYPEKQVCLMVCRISDFEGSVIGREGQKVLWCGPEQLEILDFPPANKQILDYVRKEVQSS